MINDDNGDDDDDDDTIHIDNNNNVKFYFYFFVCGSAAKMGPIPSFIKVYKSHTIADLSGRAV